MTHAVMTPQQWTDHIQDLRTHFFQDESTVPECFKYTRAFSVEFNDLVEKIAKNSSIDIFKSQTPIGAAVYSFGASARNESFGSSDADIIVYKDENTPEMKCFAELLKSSLAHYGFSKVDLPEWGTLDDVCRYQGISVTEANQIIESQFITGDPNTKRRFEEQRNVAYSPHHIARNMLFQFFYFNQYFKKKVRTGQTNLKYSDVGIRNALFFMWYSHLKNRIQAPITTSTEDGLDTLCTERRITAGEKERILKGVAGIYFLRDHMLRSKSGDSDGIVLDNEFEILRTHPCVRHYSGNDLKNMLDFSRTQIQLGKRRVWEGLKDYMVDVHPIGWKDHLDRQLSGNWRDCGIEYQDDEILNTIKIWNINEQNSDSQAIIERLADTSSWIVLASILSSEYCSGKVVDYIIRNKAIHHGYEYFLEIATRNPNIQNDTLQFMADCSHIESRYTKAAKRKLEKVQYA